MDDRPPIIDAPLHRPARWIVPCLAAAGVGMLSIYAIFDPAQHSFFPQCAFHMLTGLDCPGCGGQRALHQLLHGHIVEALQFNALFVMLSPVGLWMLTRTVVKSLTGFPLPTLFRWDGWTWCLGLVVMGFTIVRNLPMPSLFR